MLFVIPRRLSFSLVPFASVLLRYESWYEWFILFFLISGKSVKIVNGNYRGCTAEMVNIDEKTFSATVKLKDVST